MKERMHKIKNQIKHILEPVKKGVTKVVNRVVDVEKKIEATPVGGKIIKFIRIPFVSYLLLACFMNLMLETLSRHSLIKAFVFIGQSPFVFLYNALIIFVTLSLVLFAKREVFATLFVCVMWVISAFANFIVLCFRTTPFSAVDMLMIRNVMTMLDKYMTKWQMVLSAIGIVLVIALLVYLYIRLPKSDEKRRPLRASAYVCMSLILIYTVTKVAVSTQTVSDNFGNLAYAYNDYGFAYCFSNSIIDVGISKPKEYNKQIVEDIVGDLDYDKSEVILVSEEEYQQILEKQKLEQENATTEATTTETSETTEQLDANSISALTNESIEDVKEYGNANAVDEEAVAEEQRKEEEKQLSNSDNKAAIQRDTNENRADGIPDEKEDDLVTKEDSPQGDASKEDSAKEDTADTDEDLPDNVEVKFYENEEATVENPNVIVIQLESIFDVKYMKGFVPSEDPMPTYTWLKENYSTGLFTVPAVGAGTANTEFEVQTGMSTSFFGAGEYPFKTVMRSTSCDSIGYDLKRLGYATAGFHNNDATFYERYVDYSNLGFDSFTAMEHMYNLNYTPRGWAKDDVLDDTMVERMKQTEGKDYLTTITVQGHGRYPKKYTATMTDLTCHFEGQYAEDEEKRAAWTYYINMCRETDNFIASLIQKVEALDEPTVIFMYGDHLPSLSLLESDLDGITLYDTEWTMWDNIGLEREVHNMTSYQASTYIFNRLNLKGGLMQNFHNKYMNEEDHADYMNKLELLQYDTLYGKNYAFDQKNPFPQTDILYGLRKIKVEGFQIEGERLYINGEGFNEFSLVYVNGKSVKTKYISSKQLSVKLENLDDGDEIYVAQAGDDHVVLSITDSMEYIRAATPIILDENVFNSEETQEEVEE